MNLRKKKVRVYAGYGMGRNFFTCTRTLKGSKDNKKEVKAVSRIAAIGFMVPSLLRIDQLTIPGNILERAEFQKEEIGRAHV